jgi:hypothetical protein
MDNLTRLLGQSNPLGKLNLFTMPLCLYEGDPGDGGGDGGAGAAAGAGAGAAAAGSAGAAAGTPPVFVWKEKINPDLRNSPTLQKFEDTAEGLGKAIESHLSLEKLLGHDKVPIPKDDKDTEGWARFSKALGIPDKAEQYGLPDAEIPESMKGITFDKQKFAETVHSFKLTPTQAKGLWGAYTEMSKQAYAKAMETHKAAMTQTINQLRGEWGDAYEANIDLGQTVINQFAGDQETMDFLTAVLVKDPRGIKFLSKIGNQFAENKIGDFSYKKFSLSGEDAQAEIDKILADPKHPYNNEKSTEQERTRAIDLVNSYYSVIAKAKG